MAKKATMQDIADALGITKVSVSKAINNQPGIGNELRHKVLLTAKELGYAKKSRASATNAYRFAFVCPKRFFLEDDTFYTTIYYYINKTCTEQGHEISCYVINSTRETDLTIPEKLMTEHYDGIFIAGEFRHDYLQRLMRLPGAQIAIDFYLPEQNIDCVISDNYHLGQRVTDHLIQKGHTDIGFVGDYKATSSICDRYFGYEKALKLKGFPVRSEWQINNSDPLTGQYIINFPLPDPLPTAFICHCDKAAFTLMQRLDSIGIRVPQEVSIISFDNTNLCDLVLPHLSSVHFDRRQIAEYSMQSMLARIHNPKAANNYLYSKGTLIERDSVADIRQSTEPEDQAGNL